MKEINLEYYSNITVEKNMSTLFANDKIIEVIKLIEENEINILDGKNKIFNDLCEPLSNDYYDIPLKDRKKLLLIEEDSICGNQCYLENMFYNDLIYRCNCKIENGIFFNQKNNMKSLELTKKKLSENIKDYFLYLKCSLKNKRIEYTFHFYILLIIFTIHFFLNILHLCLEKKISKNETKNNPRKKIYENNMSINTIDTEKKDIKISHNKKFTDFKLKIEDSKKSEETAEDNTTKKEDNNFCYFYKRFIISKFLICKSK